MGYALMIGNCFNCTIKFSFNPLRVPSFRDSKGVRQPVCLGCITAINIKRMEKGLDAFIIPADAYEACDENELG